MGRSSGDFHRFGYFTGGKLRVGAGRGRNIYAHPCDGLAAKTGFLHGHVIRAQRQLTDFPLPQIIGDCGALEIGVMVLDGDIGSGR